MDQYYIVVELSVTLAAVPSETKSETLHPASPETPSWLAHYLCVQTRIPLYCKRGETLSPGSKITLIEVDFLTFHMPCINCRNPPPMLRARWSVTNCAVPCKLSRTVLKSEDYNRATLANAPRLQKVLAHPRDRV